MTDTPEMPRWLEEISTSLGLRSHFLLSGHIHGRYVVNGRKGPAFVDQASALWHLLGHKGYCGLLIYDGPGGLRKHPGSPPLPSGLGRSLGVSVKPRQMTPDDVLELIQAVGRSRLPVALMIDYASQYIDSLRTDGQSVDAFFIPVDRAARSGAATNPVFWVLNRPGDVPDWFAVRNPAVRAIHAALPDQEDRLSFAETLAGPMFKTAGEEEIQQFALQTEGMSLVEMDQVTRLAVAQRLPLSRVDDAIRAHRTGTPRNPWASRVMRARIAQGREILTRRVKGQDAAVDKTMQILTRSVMGLSGAQSSSRTTRPRGVLFLAGPTGVGKTELAKSVTELLFGDETAYHRFDMSEYLGENSNTKLIGAPPGAPGHEAGGELVNAVRRRPFSVFLFDEIEKAHPRVLDTFLQIIDEGRLTDGRGETAFFSESLLIFTSNIGMFGHDRSTNMGLAVLPSDTHDELEAKVIKGIQDHFRFELQRPELMNRLGQNVVVFDFINPRSADLIFDAILRRVLQTAWDETGIDVGLTDSAAADLKALCTADLFDGGRGIGNRIETHFINPLASVLFEVEDATEVVITAVKTVDGSPALVHENALPAKD